MHTHTFSFPMNEYVFSMAIYTCSLIHPQCPLSLPFYTPPLAQKKTPFEPAKSCCTDTSATICVNAIGS